MPIKTTKIKLTPKTIKRSFYALIFFSFLTTFSCLSLFLYKNFYQTITQTKEILILRQEVALETINLVQFKKIIEKLNQKIISKKIDNLNNPFD